VNSRRSLRLTFKITKGQIELLQFERLNMIAPPSVGDLPQAGTHGGYWIELRDANDRVVCHRVLHNPLRDSAEVHSPDGQIERVFGDSSESTFEVLLPDEATAKTIAVMGESLLARKSQQRSASATGELARFPVPSGIHGAPGGKVP
jgi:hypothetical protein